MGKASSSKKVQRAARAAAASRGTGESRERGFPMLVGLIVILGIGMVFAARGSRDPAVAPLLEDHWHSAYEVYDCGEVLPALQQTNDPDGIHTHADGLMHIHPFNSSATGTDAALGVFFDASGLRVRDSGIESPEFDLIDNSTGCDGEDSVIKIARWNVDGSDGVPLEVVELETVYTSDFGSVRYLENREAFTIAKVPVGEDPPPPSDAIINQLNTNTGTSIEADPSLQLPDLHDGTDDADDPETDESDSNDSGEDNPETDTVDDTETDDSGDDSDTESDTEPDAG